MQDIRLGGLCLLDTEPKDFAASERAELVDWAEEIMILILEGEMGRLGEALQS